MAYSVEIDPREITITPVFKYETVEDIPASEREGRAVMKTIECVEVRFAGQKLYAPVFPVDAQWRREGHKVITYAERWPEQYRAFLEGNVQQASGTPLEMLQSYGITPSQLSLCRVLKIYSIEALYHLEGNALKSLQMHQNALKQMATAYMNDRAKGADTTSEIEKLRAEIAALKAGGIPPQASPQEVEEAIKKADDEFAAMSDDEIKEWIADKTGAGKPRGNPARDTLLTMARELAA